MKKQGFTLVEILTVLVIISLMVTLAVPAYKRSRAGAQYDKAKGQLAQIGIAVQSFQQDLQGRFFPVQASVFGSTNNTPITATAQTAGLATEPVANLKGACVGGTMPEKNDCLRKLLFANNYLQELEFDTTGENAGKTLNGYQFWICDRNPTNEIVGGNFMKEKGCMPRDKQEPQPVATMQLITESNTPTENDSDVIAYKKAERLPYFRAIFLSDGTIEKQNFKEAGKERTVKPSRWGEQMSNDHLTLQMGD